MTGVQTCALPIYANRHVHIDDLSEYGRVLGDVKVYREAQLDSQGAAEMKSELCSVCILLDLISPTCPCHSDTQRS